MNAATSKSRLLDFPPDMFALRAGEAPMNGDFPELKKCVEWFKALMPKNEWVERRETVAKWFYQSLVGEVVDPGGLGRFFNDRDQFAWYLFLGESFTDHPWNYEPVYGCRVIPVFADAISAAATNNHAPPSSCPDLFRASTRAAPHLPICIIGWPGQARP